MFSRHTDKPEDPRATGIRPTAATGMRDVVPVPVSPEVNTLSVPGTSTSRSSAAMTSSRHAATDRSVRILGHLKGHIEAAKSVYVEEGATVDADLTADEAIIAGQYSAKLVCRQRSRSARPASRRVRSRPFA